MASSECQYGSGASLTYGTTPLLDVLMAEKTWNWNERPYSDLLLDR